MKLISNIVFFLLIGAGILLFSNCSSAQKMETKLPLSLGEVYAQKWIAGVKGGGSGVNVFIKILNNPNNIELDSIFFQGKSSKLFLINETQAIGRFKSDINQQKDVIMSNEPYAEYGNQVKKIPNKPKFELKENECVISYIENVQTKYFKIENIRKKELLAYPSAPPVKE